MVIEFCSYCNQGYLKPTEEVVLEGEVGINLIDIGGKRIFACDSCGQTQVRIRKNEYVKIRRDIKTRHWSLVNSVSIYQNCRDYRCRSY